MRQNPHEVYDAEYRVLDDDVDSHDYSQIHEPEDDPSDSSGRWWRNKFVITGGTALISIFAYAMWLGWEFAVGIVLLIFIHEMGHVIALRRFGVKASAPIFIPFLGAVIAMKQLPRNAYMEAVVGLGGPVIGSLGALAAWIVYTINGEPMFLAMAYLGVLLNLFNLLPVLPLDGGRAVGAMSRWFWVAGYAALIGLMFIRPTPIIFLILLFGAPEVWASIRHRKSGGEYYAIPKVQRVAVGAVYFGMIALLGGALVGLEPEIMSYRRG